MGIPIDRVKDWQAKKPISAGGFNAVKDTVQAHHRALMSDGIVDASGKYTRRQLPVVTCDQFQLVSETDDYLVCYEFDGDTAGTEEVYIAKPPHLRGDTATRTVGSEEQSIQPPYTAGDLIYGVLPGRGTSVTDANGEDVLWLDISPRRWAAVCEEAS